MILLVNPFISSRERYGRDVGDIGGHQMPLGIFSLAAYLLREGHSVSVVDAEARHLTHEQVLELIARERPRVVGITSTTVGFRRARGLAEMIRGRHPGITLVSGGPHTTAMPRETMGTGAFDFGIVQEGERPFAALCGHLLQGRGLLEEIPNLLLRRGEHVVDTGRRELVENLDELPPPARHLCPDLQVYRPPVGAYRRRPVASVITSRGCPYHCIFCDNNTFGRKVRYFSAEHVVAEIRSLVAERGVREIAFLDDTFVLDKRRLHRILELLRSEGLRFSWTCMTRVNNLDFETLAAMKASGCWQIRVGIESGNPQVLEFIRKGITLEQVRRATAWCRRLGIDVTGFFMIGHHIDTEQTIEETIAFALGLPLTDVVVTINTPIPGTESYRLARQHGEYREDDWTSLNYWTPVFVPHGLTSELMLAKQKEFYRRFYARPGVLARQIRKVRDLSTLRSYARSFLLGRRFLAR